MLSFLIRRGAVQIPINSVAVGGGDWLDGGRTREFFFHSAFFLLNKLAKCPEFIRKQGSFIRLAPLGLFNDFFFLFQLLSSILLRRGLSPFSGKHVSSRLPSQGVSFSGVSSGGVGGGVMGVCML